jgi:predicted negative regulator of RcsB-dependent stress response
MKPRFVSAVAVLFCCAILAMVFVFGYSRYKAAQVKNAEFQAQLQSGAESPQAALPTQMPAQLPPHIGILDLGAPTPTPAGP